MLSKWFGSCLWINFSNILAANDGKLIGLYLSFWFLGPFLRGIMLANLKDAGNFEAKIA